RLQRARVPPRARAALAEHQRTDEAAVADDDLAILDLSGAAREVHELLGAGLRGSTGLAERGEVEVVDPRRHVVDAGLVLLRLPRDVRGEHARLHLRGLSELEALILVA